MTNNELNQFILHYLVEDKTHSAIMLTGAWGTGKSYYIQNELVPFLKEEHEKECVTVSLYGIKSTAEISRSIYIELRAKTLSAKGEAAVAGKLIAKTIVRGVVSRFGIDFSKENDTMQELYESINLSNKLVILEDIERSQIEVIELLGYVNSLVEQDNVIVHYDPKTMHKILVIIRPAKSDSHDPYYQIVVEELWAPGTISPDEDVVLTNFIHGCYYPSNHSFDHIDFSVNQYSKEEFLKKYADNVSENFVSIEQHANEHYKVWCIKGVCISLQLWSELVNCTLDEPFRRLFAEIIGAEIIEED